MLLGAELDTPTGLVIGRIAGAALFALAVICWQARTGEPDGVAAAGVVSGMCVYNVAAALIVAYASMGLGLHSALMWPVVVIHVAFAAWCGALLWVRSKRLDDAASS
jgi:hypothetical protein